MGSLTHLANIANIANIAIMNIITIPATKAKNAFAELIDKSRTSTINITRNNRRVGVLLSPEEYDHLTAIEDAYWAKLASTPDNTILGPKENEEFLKSLNALLDA